MARNKKSPAVKLTAGDMSGHLIHFQSAVLGTQPSKKASAAALQMFSLIYQGRCTYPAYDTAPV